MINITVCVGSSCHLKGAGDVVAALQSEIAERGLGDEISLNGSFCMGECIHDGVSVRVDGEIVFVQPAETRKFFEENIMPKVKR